VTPAALVITLVLAAVAATGIVAPDLRRAFPSGAGRRDPLPAHAGRLGVAVVLAATIAAAMSGAAALAGSAPPDGAAPRPAAAGDVAAQLDRGIRALRDGDLTAASERFVRVLTLEPDNAAAHAHLGLILYLGGRAGDGLREVDRALGEDPSYAPASLFRGLILLRGLGRPADAVPSLAAYVAAAAPGADRREAVALLREARGALR
jgi:predicted Zn-dependent protease